MSGKKSKKQDESLSSECTIRFTIRLGEEEQVIRFTSDTALTREVWKTLATDAWFLFHELLTLSGSISAKHLGLLPELAEALEDEVFAPFVIAYARLSLRVNVKQVYEMGAVEIKLDAMD